MNRETIKYIAIICMTLNHISHTIMQYGTKAEVFEDIGYFTAVTMCFFLVEGYHYTRSKKQYALRLFIFAGIAQVPFSLAFRMYSFSFDMLFTLFLCFLILCARDYIQNPVLRTLAVFGLVFLTRWCDWPYLAAIYTLLFAATYGDRIKQALSFAAAALLFVGFEYLSYRYRYLPLRALSHSVLAAIPLLVSGIVVLFLYNGKRAQRGKAFHKYFFYVYYPAHLLILYFLAKRFGKFLF